MLKKALIGVIVLTLIGVGITCAVSRNGNDVAAPTVTTPVETETPAVEDNNDVVDPETGAISIETFIKRAMNDKYQMNTEVVLIGKITNLNMNNNYGAAYVYFGPYKKYLVKVEGREKAIFSKFQDVEIDQRVVIKGKFYYIRPVEYGDTSLYDKIICISDGELVKALQ